MPTEVWTVPIEVWTAEALDCLHSVAAVRRAPDNMGDDLGRVSYFHPCWSNINRARCLFAFSLVW